MKNLIAQGSLPLGPGFSGPGPLGTSGSNAPDQFNSTLSTIIGVLTVVAFIWFTFQIIIGAIRILGSGGDKGAVESARKQITSAIVGVILVVVALFIVDLIGTLLGIPNILNPTNILIP